MHTMDMRWSPGNASRQTSRSSNWRQCSTIYAVVSRCFLATRRYRHDGREDLPLSQQEVHEIWISWPTTGWATVENGGHARRTP
jgi:hypothetical protein